MSIVNDLNNHVGEIRTGLRKDSLKTPDRLLQILDSHAKYQTGAATEGYSFSHLRRTPKVTFYRGADRYEAAEADPTTTRLIVPWANVMCPIEFLGTDLEETVGMTADDMTDDGYSLAGMREDQQEVFMDFVKGRVTATAAAMQNGRVNVLWGNDANIQYVSADRLPTSIPEIFDPETGLYGEDKDALGTFEKGHPWADNYAFGRSENFLMTPRVWDLAKDDGGSADAAAGTAMGTTAVDISLDENFESLYHCISQYSQIVPGTKVAICDNAVFTKLALRYAKAEGSMANKFPTLVGTDRWQLTVRSVLIEDTYFISEPYKTASDNSIFVIHVGDRGANEGTLFPFYWEKEMSISELMRSEQEMMLRDIPDGLTWGPRRDVPFYMDKFTRFAGNADAVGSHERLKWMLVCTEPWCQLLINNVGTG